MLVIREILVSDEVVKEQFLCQLSVCKGACCWEGDLGAPLDVAELSILTQIYDKIKPFLTKQGISAIEEVGKFTYDEDEDEHHTTLINGGACAYINYDAHGIAQCGIERAYIAGLIDFKKPISCHLYPIRVFKNSKNNFEALNYDRWKICASACRAGKKAKLPVYQFLKDAIIRKYGQDFYDELDAAAQHLQDFDYFTK